MADPSVTLRLAEAGPEGDRTVELEPGDSFAETVDGPVYIEVDVPDVEVDGDGMVVEVADTTHEQDEVAANGDRIDERAKRTCEGCGDKYPTSYSMCPGCGNPNPKG